jgi:hypothetical protein
VLNVIGYLVDLEPEQASLLDKVCAAPKISEEELKISGALDIPEKSKPATKKKEKGPSLFDPQ